MRSRLTEHLLENFDSYHLRMIYEKVDGLGDELAKTDSLIDGRHSPESREKEQSRAMVNTYNIPMGFLSGRPGLDACALDGDPMLITFETPVRF